MRPLPFVWPYALVFWAVWMLVFHWIDQFWIVMPEFSRKVTLGLPELLCLIGIGGVFAGLPGPAGILERIRLVDGAIMRPRQLRGAPAPVSALRSRKPGGTEVGDDT